MRPAIAACRARGIDVDGPFPADTIFLRATKGEFDAVIACYHDQGLIPVKMAAFGRAVNVTLGLPIVRTGRPRDGVRHRRPRRRRPVEPRRGGTAGREAGNQADGEPMNRS